MLNSTLVIEYSSISFDDSRACHHLPGPPVNEDTKLKTRKSGQALEMFFEDRRATAASQHSTKTFKNHLSPICTPKVYGEVVRRMDTRNVAKNYFF